MATINGGAGDDLLSGTGPDDIINGLGGNDQLTDAAGNDKLNGGIGNDSLSGGENNDTLLGAADVLDGGIGNDTLKGGNGNDVLDGGDGIDVMTGGTGDDFYVVEQTADKVTELANQGRDTVESHVFKFTLGANFENLILLDGAVNGTGNTLANDITGNEAANTLDGGSGNDVLRGRGGGDSLLGGAGSDELLGDGGADTLKGGAGNDTLNGGLGADVLFGEGGNDRFVYAVESEDAAQRRWISPVRLSDRLQAALCFLSHPSAARFTTLYDSSIVCVRARWHGQAGSSLVKRTLRGLFDRRPAARRCRSALEEGFHAGSKRNSGQRHADGRRVERHLERSRRQ